MGKKRRTKAPSARRRTRASGEMPLRARKAGSVKAGTDGSGNTIYVSAGGGVWKSTSRRLSG